MNHSSHARGIAASTAACLSLTLFAAPPAQAQVTPLPHDQGAVGLGLALRHLPVDGRLLYVTAHPDDENNGVLVKYSRGLGYETSLLTVTRGDGGQNEIGPELFQAIGILRSEELAGVHRYDGVAQFHTRAFEFGYSFSVEETFDKWGREDILRDVVRVFRTVRPDVVLTMSRESSGGGQHHQASARLAHEAFRAAADPTRFPKQIQEGLRPWQAQKVYMSAGGRNQPGSEGSVRVDTSKHDPLLGMSWNQFGTLARRAHRCQGMGQLEGRPGVGSGAYKLVDSAPTVTAAEQDIFEGVDTSLMRWMGIVGDQKERVPFLEEGIQAIEAAAREASDAFDLQAAHETLAPLAKGLHDVRQLRSQLANCGLTEDAAAELDWRLEKKEGAFERALGLAQGLQFHVTVDDGDVIPGQTFTATAELWNLSPGAVTIDELSVRGPEGWAIERVEGEPGRLEAFAGATVEYRVTVGDEARYTQPYWKRNFEVDRFDIEIPEHVTLPWSPPDLVGEVTYTTQGVSSSLELPAYYRYDGPWVGGEKQKVVNVVPALSVKVTPRIAVIPLSAAGSSREFRVKVLHNAKHPSTATVKLEAPEGWSVEPAMLELGFNLEGEEATARFSVTLPDSLEERDFQIHGVATMDGRAFREGYQVIAYDHTQERHLFHAASSNVKAIDVTIRDDVEIGYVMGAGDEVPPAIEQLGFKFSFLSPDDIAFGDLSRYSTIITGIRAYQTRPELKAQHKRMMAYVESGGHLVVQYNKFEFNQLAERAARRAFGPGARREAPVVTSPFAPYPAAVSRNRITVEETPIRLLDADSPLLVAPNRIAETDFEDWVQERGLYFLDARGEQYVELMAAEDPWPNNPGEKQGMLVTSDVGKGTWTYVGIGLWRQLPAGTRGAYRILANLLSQPPKS